MWWKVQRKIGGKMRDLGNYNLIRKVNNESLFAYYYPPKTKIELEDLLQENGVADFNDKTPSEIKAMFNKKNGSLGDYNKDSRIRFLYKDGTEDVYTKSGYEHEIFEYAERNSTQKRKYRLQTDETHIDFMAGGKIEIPGEEPYLVLKVINMTNDVSTLNQYKLLNSFERTPKDLEKAWQIAPKIIALI
jgi:hypothetical protein